MHTLRRALTLITAAVALGLGASTSLGAVQVPWATQAGGSAPEQDISYGVSTLADGSSIVTGYFSGTATFGSTTLASAGDREAFVAKFLFLDAPQAPAAPRAVAGDGQATVTVTPLAGGSVTTYSVLASPGGRTCTITAPATSCTISGLTNGTLYTFTDTATNAAGTSPASTPSNAVTPTAAAATPTTTTPTMRPTVLPSRARHHSIISHKPCAHHHAVAGHPHQPAHGTDPRHGVDAGQLKAGRRALPGCVRGGVDPAF